VTLKDSGSYDVSNDVMKLSIS